MSLYKFSGRSYTTQLSQYDDDDDENNNKNEENNKIAPHDRPFGNQLSSLELFKNGTFKSVESLSTPVKLETIQCSGSWTKEGSMYKLKIEQVGPTTKAFHKKVSNDAVGRIFTFDETEFVKAGEGKVLKSLFNQWNMVRVTEDIFQKKYAKVVWAAVLIVLGCLLVYFLLSGNNGQSSKKLKDEE